MSGECARCGSCKIFESQPVDTTAPGKQIGAGEIGDSSGAGQYCVNDLQTKLEKKTRAVGSICCWVRSGIKMTTQTFQIRFHTQTKHETMATVTAEENSQIVEWECKGMGGGKVFQRHRLNFGLGLWLGRGLKIATTLAHRVRHCILVYFVLLKRLMGSRLPGWVALRSALNKSNAQKRTQLVCNLCSMEQQSGSHNDCLLSELQFEWPN